MTWFWRLNERRNERRQRKIVREKFLSRRKRMLDLMGEMLIRAIYLQDREVAWWYRNSGRILALNDKWFDNQPKREKP